MSMMHDDCGGDYSLSLSDCFISFTLNYVFCWPGRTSVNINKGANEGEMKINLFENK